MAEEQFSIIATMFKRYTDYGKDENGNDKGGSYTYEITFNRSMVHMGRFSYMEEGLNNGLAKELEQQKKREEILSKLTKEERDILNY